MAAVSAEGPSRRRGPLARALGWPLRRALDRRVQWGAGLVDERVQGSLAEHRAALEQSLAELRELVAGLRDHGLSVERRVDSNERELLRILGSLHARVAGGGPEALAELGPDLAAFLNWNAGPRGYGAQGGLWFNPPVAVEYLAGAVAPLLVNERIVEQPFVLRALSGLASGASVLDVGGAESTLALSLSASGYAVTVVDPRGYPLEHPGLRSVAGRLDELDATEPGFDAAIAVSAVEHFGLSHYGGAQAGAAGAEARADLEALESLRRLVAPGGLLVLTVPIGTPSVDDFQRVYDARGVRELLEGWTLRELSAAWRQDRLTWVPGELDEPAGDSGVALAVAVNDAPPHA
jgi:Methyltransferase domain